MEPSGTGFDAGTVDAMLPGVELAGLLSRVDTNALNGCQRVSVLEGWQKVMGWAAAGFYEAMSYVARSGESYAEAGVQPLSSDVVRFAVEEVAAALGVSMPTAGNKLALARDLMGDLPATLAALRAGLIDESRAKMIADTTRGLGPEDRGVAERWVLAQHVEQRLSWAQLSRRLTKKVLSLIRASGDVRWSVYEDQP